MHNLFKRGEQRDKEQRTKGMDRKQILIGESSNNYGLNYIKYKWSKSPK